MDVFKKATPYCGLQFGMEHDWHSEEGTKGPAPSQMRERLFLLHSLHSPLHPPSSGELGFLLQSLRLIPRITGAAVVRVPSAGRVKAPCRRGFDLAGVQVTDDKLRVLIDEHARQRQHGAGAAQRGQLAAEQQLGQQQVAHHVQVAEDVEGDSGGEGDDAAAGQVVQDRAQAAEQDEDPQAAVVVQRPLQQGPVLQGQSRHGQDAEAGDGHQVEQEDGVDFLLLKQDACANRGGQTRQRARQSKKTTVTDESALRPERSRNAPGAQAAGADPIHV